MGGLGRRAATSWKAGAGSASTETGVDRVALGSREVVMSSSGKNSKEVGHRCDSVDDWMANWEIKKWRRHTWREKARPGWRRPAILVGRTGR
ncbi:hypothetical protein HPP92_023116 [Vanilla planifolia]|uniref:Uncharacterized protein n=1 Tax=Vanilla planifolia TaxID=51239 RepID=A0A835UCJ3_VANPL|nr:hypothetical protein HPP92_023116 [Vanilla planifolia]